MVLFRVVGDGGKEKGPAFQMKAEFEFMVEFLLCSMMLAQDES